MQAQIPGLEIHPHLISLAEQQTLTQQIDSQPWQTEMRRRVQHHGYRYDYKRRRIEEEMYLGPLPDWADQLAGRLHFEGYLPELPDQVIVNEYEPGQGINPHIDCVPCFGDVIASLSLLSACVMDFTHAKTGEKVSHLLRARSLLVMQGEARHGWKHGIAPRKTDQIDGFSLPRARRISITFRTVCVGRN